INGPRAVVLSGDAGPVEAAAAQLEAAGHRVTRLAVSRAFHSHQMDGMLDDLRAAAHGITVTDPQLTVIGNETAAPLTAAQLADPDRWARHARGAVRFAEGIAALAADGVRTFIELGPRGALCATAPACLPDDVDAAFVPALRAHAPEPTAHLAALGAAWTAGVAIDWPGFFAPLAPRVADLPTSVFQRQRYWLDAPRGLGDAAALGLARDGHPLLGAAVSLPDGGLVFTGRLSRQSHPWVADHAVSGRALLPGTAFLDLAQHAALRVGAGMVAELVLTAPLVLPEKEAVALRVTVEPAEADWTLAVHGRPADAADEAPWTLHAEGRLSTDEPAPGVDLSVWPPAGAEALDLDGLYPRLAASGFAYGPRFQGLRAAWRQGETLFAEVRAPEGLAEEAFGLHPALLDAALHADLLAEGEPPALPFAWRGARLHAIGARALRVRLVPDSDAIALDVADATGAPVAHIAALQTRPLVGGLDAAPGTCALYRVAWIPAAAAEPVDPARWAWVGDGVPYGMIGLARALDAVALDPPPA
ncbi:MAG: type I polyketide synthase, partial [Myxococcales bacterium]|nr:type I polyketide synthase [Myxococcales bacterium]